MFHLIETTEATINFIDKYLSEEEKVEKSNKYEGIIRRRWEELNYDFIDVIEEDITYYIRTYLPSKPRYIYQKFRETYYWKIIADYKKLLANWNCQMNWEHDSSLLDVHHGNYPMIHGMELRKIPGSDFQYMSLLTVLCRECHTGHHDRENGVAPKPELHLPIMLTENSFESTKVMQEYINFKLAQIEYNVFEENKRLIL